MTTPPRIASRTPEEQLLRRTRLRLAAMTLALVAALLAAVGVVTSLAATRLMDANVGRTMDAVMLTALDDDPEHDEDKVLRTPGGSDTFVLYLDARGRMVGNPSRVVLKGLPDAAAMGAASAGTDDRRDGTYDGVPVRLLTRHVEPGEMDEHDGDGDGDAGSVAFVQVGFVLSLYQAQQRELAIAIVAAVSLGIAGAALVTWAVTHRALAPIRAAFAAERRFVAAASHELRTPVAIIRASAEVMQRERHTTPAGDILLADIVAETDRMGRLVGDLLALASAEAGAIAIDPRPMDLGAWLDDTARRARPMVAARGLTLTTAIEGAHGTVVVADPDRLTQIVLVLVDNAVAHSPEGGTVEIAAARDGTRVVAISVTDEGPGVPDNLRETIFEPFVRTPGVGRTQGSGLGLAIARQLATRQGATLEVAGPRRSPDQQGRGACFVLRLPATAIAPVPPGRTVPGAVSSG